MLMMMNITAETVKYNNEGIAAMEKGVIAAIKKFWNNNHRTITGGFIFLNGDAAFCAE